MRLIKLSVISFVMLVICLPIQVSANRVWVQTHPYVKLNTLYELDRIKGNDLQVNLALEILISSTNFSKYNKNVTLSLDISEPLFWVSGYNRPNIVFCEGSITGLDYVRGPNIKCIDKKIVLNTTKEDYIRPTYKITFDVPELQEWKRYVLKINYTIQNFVNKQGRFYLAWFQTNCIPNEDCPTSPSGNIARYVVLPSENSVPERFPEDVTPDITNNKWVFHWDSFGRKQIWFSDSFETEFMNPLVWVLFGFLLAILAGFLWKISIWVWNKYKKGKMVITIS